MGLRRPLVPFYIYLFQN